MSDKKKLKRPASMMGAGLAIGAGVGVALDNIGLGIALGVAIGAALTGRQKKNQKPPEDVSPPKEDQE